jgi:hypothetical protein
MQTPDLCHSSYFFRAGRHRRAVGLVRPPSMAPEKGKLQLQKIHQVMGSEHKEII